MQNRLKSKVVWGAILAQVLAILLALGVIAAGLSEAVNALITAALQLLVVAGVLNNPTDPTGF